MSAPIAVRASYSDFKLIRTRSMAQIVLEIDIDKAEDFVTAFGLPVPGKERPVALALLNSAPSAPDAGRPGETPAEPQASPKAGGSERPQRDPSAAPDRLVAYVAMACGDPRFQQWLKGYIDLANDLDHQGAIACVRQLLGVKSRSEISTNPIARQKAKDLMGEYDIFCGRHAENRG